jgi:hypothetical protein
MIGSLRFLLVPRAKGAQAAANVEPRALLDADAPAAVGPLEQNLPGTCPAAATAPRINARQGHAAMHLPLAGPPFRSHLGYRSMR